MYNEENPLCTSVGYQLEKHNSVQNPHPYFRGLLNETEKKNALKTVHKVQTLK